jgi:hypothetical protein
MHGLAASKSAWILPITLNQLIIMLHNFFRTSPRSSHRKKEYDFGPAGSLPIGQGGSGQVMRARSKDGQCVAVKVVRKEAVMEHSEYLKIIHE